MYLTIKYPFLPKSRSLATTLIMDTFGIDFDQGDHIIAENLEVNLQLGQIVLFTGPSGSGKSSLLKAVVAELQQDKRHHLINIDQLVLPDLPLIDALSIPIQDSLHLLTACGL